MHQFHNNFADLPGTHQARQDLIRLTSDKDHYVRRKAVDVIGTAFPHVPDKDAAWQDLHRLTLNKNWDVRVAANYSLGKASVLKAIEAEGEEDFRRELENALKFFENLNSARFRGYGWCKSLGVHRNQHLVMALDYHAFQFTPLCTTRMRGIAADEVNTQLSTAIDSYRP